MQRLSNLSWKVDVAIFAGCALFLAIGYQMRFQRLSRNSSVCVTCGMLRDITARKVPGLGLTIFQRSALQSTPVSETLRTNSIVGVHRHDWQLVHASGPNLLCALGRARSVASTVRAEEVADLVNTLHRLGATEVRDKVITNVFSSETTMLVRLISQSSTQTFASRIEIDTWFHETCRSLDLWGELK